MDNIITTVHGAVVECRKISMNDGSDLYALDLLVRGGGQSEVATVWAQPAKLIEALNGVPGEGEVLALVVKAKAKARKDGSAAYLSLSLVSRAVDVVKTPVASDLPDAHDL